MAEDTAQKDINTGKPQEEGDVSIYELGYHLVPTIPEEQVTTRAEELQNAIVKHKGVVISEGAPKKIALAYTMKKNVGGKYERYDNAYFGYIKFEMEPKEASIVHDEVKVNENVLRFLLVKTLREDTMHFKSLQKPPVDVLKGKTIQKPKVREEPRGTISEEELDKTIEKMVAE